MPPPPSAAALPLLPCLVLLFSLAEAAAAVHNGCIRDAELHPCAPFRSLPSFPFGVYPGCGHPAFQIRCSSASKHYLMKINGFSFLLLNHSVDSLLVTPVGASPSTDIEASCGVGAHIDRLPLHQIDISGSPFRISDTSCSSLASIRPCRSDLLDSSANCTGGDSGPGLWQRRLLSQPILLLKGCDGSPYGHSDTPGDATDGGCHTDVSSAIADFLQSGIRIEFRSDDPYFVSCSSCRRKTGTTAACGFNNSYTDYPFLCLGSAAPHTQRRTNRVVVLSATLFAFACVATLAVSAAIFYRRSVSLGARHGIGGEDPMTAFLRRHRLQLQPPVFTYDQLCFSTGGFDSKRLIGDGGFGSVYFAQLEDGRNVAVKRLHRHHPAATTKSFCNEILILSSIQHPNLVRLHGYCCDPRGLLLVYDYVPNGTLADHLHGSRILYKKGSLTWAVRVDVALQTAIALEYLHFTVKPPVVHRDITSSNIFVDEDMRIKVGDFGLSRLLSLPDPSSCSGTSSSEYVCTGPQGTPGYLDPEYHRSFRLTEKSDVYSFGVVLLELLTGMKAVDLRREKQDVSLANLVVSKIQVGALQQVVDPVLVRQGQTMGTIEAMAELAFRCVAGEKDDRPDARELVSELRRIQTRVQEDTKGS